MATIVKARSEHTCQYCGHRGVVGLEAYRGARFGTRRSDEYDWYCSDAQACGARLRGGAEPKPFDPDLPFD